MVAVRDSPERLARGLGWFSAGLGLPQVLAPGAVARFVGVDDTPGTRRLVRIVGVRELTAAGGIFAQSRPAGWLWARVAGDAKDLALLGVALARGDNRRGRVAAARAAVAGVTALDVLAAARLSRAVDEHSEDGTLRAKAVITVNSSPEDAYRRWRDFENLPAFMVHLESVKAADGRSHWVARGPAGTTVEWDAEIVDDVRNQRIAWRSIEGADVDNSGSIRFTPAPGNRGTEVTVELEYSPPGGAVGAMVAKLLGEEPNQQLRDDLRRFKQVLETGEVVVSEGTPDGTRTHRQLKQRDAQPVA
jgi:uncharacterized membrane protein